MFLVLYLTEQSAYCVRHSLAMFEYPPSTYIPITIEVKNEKFTTERSFFIRVAHPLC